jgi:hypothetical protein
MLREIPKDLDVKCLPPILKLVGKFVQRRITNPAQRGVIQTRLPESATNLLSRLPLASAISLFHFPSYIFFNLINYS